MSLGDYTERQQKILLSVVLGGPIAAMLISERVVVGLSFAAIILAFLAFQLGRAIEHDKMKRRKWYSENNYD